MSLFIKTTNWYFRTDEELSEDLIKIKLKDFKNEPKIGVSIGI